MKKVRKNALSDATAIVTPLTFLISLATRRFCRRLVLIVYSRMLSCHELFYIILPLNTLKTLNLF